jgi:BolA protein
MTLEDVSARRIERIRAALCAALAPLELEITDEGHRHRGHAGAASGAGHFHVRIVSAAFAGRPRIWRHRSVYSALQAELGPEIHALALETLAPGEPGT